MAITIESFGKDAADGDLKVTDVRMPGCDTKIDWQQTCDGLIVTSPGRKIDGMAMVFRVETE